MNYLILIVDDDRDVLFTVKSELQDLSSMFTLETAESADEALEVIEEFEADEGQLALIICDHLMPNKLGVDFLIELEHRSMTQASKKLLLTGQADHQDTIKAINQGGLDHYIAKPWDPVEFSKAVKNLLTDYVIAFDSQPERFTRILNQEKIFNFIHERGDL
ncbi:response regulator [Pseudobacteriovorax antillogorgiicola]|uniref:Response regulator receiver domain-containing protein n=1 Tax=Pseudobacteriovorax antillogorgiicola TaxID=1513793 RepID=A0A1Y6BTI2_9BACT|nr:response regulator [Pseudobacteriovorax antillogorgiicola]TCS54617.1 response regulator receiver domain-containing protein [Pseudobacteriovorax antillogorgiicola]SMF17417.1 Response regulator receiver domain-containing protein [Pseudobacteriovorax antillogorgiicola]